MEFWLKMQEFKIWKKHACQTTVAMKTSNFLDQEMSYQIVVRSILGKVAKVAIGGVCFNIKRKKIINVQSEQVMSTSSCGRQRGHFYILGVREGVLVEFPHPPSLLCS